MNLGNISPNDLHLFLELSEKLLNEAGEAKRLLFDREEDFFAPDCNKSVWCHLYELPILEHALQGAAILGEGDAIQRLAGSKNQITEACSLLNEADAEIDAWAPTPEEKGLCCTNDLTIAFPLTPDGFTASPPSQGCRVG